MILEGSIIDPVSILPAMAALLLATTTAYFLARKNGILPLPGRYASIDGLRGYLAFFVFMHHSSIWFYFLRSGQWQVPPSNVYTNFGQGSVSLFFMITGFLFYSKLIDGREQKFSWRSLYVSRIFRLVPLHLFVVALLFAVVASLSGWHRMESMHVLILELVRWLGFAMFGLPDINGISHTYTIVAGVTWSLAYEWFFYLCLPILALSLSHRPPAAYLLLGVCALIALSFWHTSYLILSTFAGGILAAWLVRIDSFRRFAEKSLASFIVIACLVSVVAFSREAYGVKPLLLLTTAFVLMASGNTLFGLLVHPVSRTLGEMAYSIYLLHGMLLFVTFNFVIGLEKASAFSPLMHWLAVLAITPVLILVSYSTFVLIEKPGMRLSRIVNDRMQNREKEPEKFSR